MNMLVFKNSLLSLVIFSVIPLFNHFIPSTEQMTFGFSVFIVNPIYIIVDNAILTKKYGIKMWIVFSSTMLFILPLLLLIGWEIGASYLVIYMIVSLLTICLTNALCRFEKRMSK